MEQDRRALAIEVKKAELLWIPRPPGVVASISLRALDQRSRNSLFRMGHFSDDIDHRQAYVSNTHEVVVKQSPIGPILQVSV